MFEVFKAIRARARLNLSEANLQIKQNEQLESLFYGSGSQNRDELNQLGDPDSAKWVLLGGDGAGGQDTVGRKTLRSSAIVAYYRNPHARNILRLFEKYVVGRGFLVQPKSTLEEVREYWDTFWRTNRMELRKKEIVRRGMRDGEVFIRFFKKNLDDDKSVVVVRFMNPDLVENPVESIGKDEHIASGIETDPEDVEEVLAYWYKGVRIEAEEVLHIKILVDSDVMRGRTYLEPILKHLEQFRQWLDNRMKLNQLRTIVGMIRRVKGTPTQAANIKAQQETTRNLNPDGSAQSRAPEGVSIITTNEGVDYEFKTPNLQAADVQHDGRGLLLTIAAGSGLPEYMITSDASNSNFASTMIAEAPGVKEFVDWQDFFGEYFKIIFTKIILVGIEDGAIPETEEVVEYEEIDVEVPDESPDPFKAMQDRVSGKTALPVPGEVDEEGDEEEEEEEEPIGTHKEMQKQVKEITKKIPTNTEAIVVFPELVHRDIQKETNALQVQSDMEILSKHTMSARLDLDYDEEQALIAREEQSSQDAEPEIPGADEDVAQQSDEETHRGAPDEEREPKT